MQKLFLVLLYMQQDVHRMVSDIYHVDVYTLQNVF